MALYAQVIDGDGQYTGELEAALEAGGLTDRGLSYTVLAVLGCQSSGKSTLLNLLFGLQFPMMEASSGRHQTTRGVYAATANSPPLEGACRGRIMVFDTEGTDSRERAERSASFERKIGLFALAVSDVLLINLWMADIGRYNAANYALIKNVFELNLQLFQVEHSKKTTILFVIRDHIRQMTPLERLQEQVIEDMNTIWGQLSKPDAFVHSRVEDFFTLRFCSLSHKVLAGEDFAADVRSMRDRYFSLTGADTVLTAPPEPKRVPADGFSDYARNLWDAIRANRDLDLPTERQVVSTFRCTGILQEVIQSRAQPLFDRINSDYHRHNMAFSPFGLAVQDMLEGCYGDYEKRTQFYDPEIRANKRRELHGKLMELFQPLYVRQLSFLRHRLLAVFAREFDAVLREAPVCVKFTDTFRELRGQIMGEFVVGLQAETSEAASWTEGADERKLLEEELDRVIATSRRSQIDALHILLRNKTEQRVRGEIQPVLNSQSDNLWTAAKEIREQLLKATEKDLMPYVIGFEMSDAEKESLQKVLHDAVDTGILACFRDATERLGGALRNRFDDEFKRDGSGMPRNFVSEQQIRECFSRARRSVMRTLDDLFVFRLTNPYDELHLFDIDAPDSAVDDVYAAVNFPRGDKAEQAAEAGHFLIDVRAVHDVHRQLTLHAENSFNDAANALRRNEAARGLPLWVYALLVILGWNEFVAVLSHPIGLVLLIGAATLAYMYYQVPQFRAYLALFGLVTPPAAAAPAAAAKAAAAPANKESPAPSPTSSAAAPSAASGSSSSEGSSGLRRRVT